ncbi:MAG TPA: hypothetical protein VHF89_12175 [Solirubrobacteraceae bacterium]|nr:hypothetical protein [Solirubrobacteraceae bacterium]
MPPSPADAAGAEPLGAAELLALLRTGRKWGSAVAGVLAVARRG